MTEVSYLNLHTHASRDVRKIIYKMLSRYDLEVVRCAHNSHRKPLLSSDFSYHCAKKGYVKLLTWAQWNYCHIDIYTCNYAARNGHLNILQAIHTKYGEIVTYDSIGVYAARGCHIHILQWLRDNNFRLDLPAICVVATRNGYLNLLEWAVINGCPELTEVIYNIAESAGQSVIMEWLTTTYKPITISYEPK